MPRFHLPIHNIKGALHIISRLTPTYILLAHKINLLAHIICVAPLFVCLLLFNCIYLILSTKL